MHGPSLPSDGFLGRLKTHKVIQWTLAYAALAYTVLHGVEMVAGALNWPHVIARVLTLVLILGIPVIATLAWYHGAKGLKKISGPELAILTVLLFIAGSILWGFSGTGAEQKTAQTEQRAPAAAAPVATPPAAEPALSTPAAPRTAVAVLPFANLTGDASKEYLGDGMAEELINTLTKVQGLKVPARTSTFAYKGRNTDIRQIAKDLGVGTILEGSVRAAGKRLRITAQLINAQDGLHLWSQTYDEEFTDIFKLQDKLANAIALALEPKLADAGASPVTPILPTQDVEAYNLYLQGWSLVGRPSPENLQRAIDNFNQALARDPNFAQAHAGMAEAYSAMVSLGAGTQTLRVIAAAEQAARQALALDASLAYPHLALAGIAAGRGQLVEAQAQDQAALSLAPNDGYVHIIRGLHLCGDGRLKDCLDAGQRAYALAPANPTVVALYAGFNAAAGRDADASRYAAAAIDLGYPKDSGPLAIVAELAAWRSGHYAEAAALNAKVSNDPRVTESARLAYGALEHPAQRATALAAIARLFSAAPAQIGSRSEYVSACLDGVQWMAIAGGLDEAFALANQCLTRVDPGMVVTSSFYQWLPEMRPFRRDARFGDLVTRSGMMQYYRQYGPPDECDLKNNQLTCH
jgi:TolB-like protein/Tfp pilus assembly protein PilF